MEIRCKEQRCTNLVFEGHEVCIDHIPKKKEEIVLPSQVENYYDVGGMSNLDVMKAKMTKEGLEGFYEGCIIKYALRWKEKGGIHDLIKLVDYAKMLIKSKQGE